MHDIFPKFATLGRAHQNNGRQAVASNDLECVAMQQKGIQVYPDVFKKADLYTISPDGIAKEKGEHQL